jgi:heptosyltransferase-2
MKVLVIQQRMGIGDMVIFLPYIHAISEKYDVPVSVLAKKNSKIDELCEDDKNIKEIIFLDRGKNKSGRHDGLIGFFNLVKDIKEKKFDKVFIFNGSLRFKLLAKMSGIQSVYQYPLFKKKDNIVLSAKSFIEHYIKETVSTESKLELSTSKIQKSKEKYTFDKNFKHVCFGFSASGPTKRWDIEKYIQLAIELKKMKPCKFYLAGGMKDEIFFKKFLDSSVANDCILFKDISIKESIPIIKNCDIYVGNDTGWLHISAALNLRCLALFMDSPVLAYGKYSKNISVIVPEGETEATTTHGTLGKRKINFNEVLEKTKKLLN